MLPAFPVPDGTDEGKFLETEAHRGLEALLDDKFENEQTPLNKRDAVSAPYHARLQSELRVIRSMGFPGYFLIVAESSPGK